MVGAKLKVGSPVGFCEIEGWALTVGAKLKVG